LVWFGLSHFFPNQKLNCSVSAEISETKIETVYIGLVWFKLSLRLFHMATLAQTGLCHELTPANQMASATAPASTAFINKTPYFGRIACKT